jgi:ribonuclease HI
MLSRVAAKELEIYIDGASQGNPGPSGIGVIITEDGEVVKNLSVYLGVQTNNVAEYMALIFGMQEALLRRANSLRIYTDSQLLCRQINNEYKIKSPNLIGLYYQIQHLKSGFERFEISYISRENNRGADKLAKKATRAR